MVVATFPAVPDVEVEVGVDVSALVAKLSGRQEEQGEWSNGKSVIQTRRSVRAAYFALCLVVLEGESGVTNLGETLERKIREVDEETRLAPDRRRRLRAEKVVVGLGGREEVEEVAGVTIRENLRRKK